MLDGLGSPPQRAELAVADGRVRILPAGADPPAATVIEAHDCYVCPGFIDTHGHSDFASLIHPNAASRVAAGVTCEVVGNCGYGAFPLAGEALRRRADEHRGLLQIDWTDAGGYLARSRAVGCAIHRVVLIGHGNVRGCVVGYGPGRPGAAQLRQMEQIVDQAMAAGCAGLSSGLIYPPGMWADPAELSALAAVVARYGGVYTSHIRSEGDRLIESVEEFLAVCKAAGCAGLLSHVKTSGPANWSKIGRLGQVLHAARDEGLTLHCDRYPYLASSTDLAAMVLPDNARSGTTDQVLARLADRDSRSQILREIRAARGADLDDWLGRIVVTSVANPALSACVGKRLAQLPGPMEMADPLEAAVRLIYEDRTDSYAIHHSMSEANLRTIYSWPFVAVGSDSSLRDSFEGGASDVNLPHPRAYGTPAEFVDLVVGQWELMDWPEAIRRMTSLPAEIFGLIDRGRLVDNAPADVVVLDPRQFRSRSTYEHPRRAPAGVRATLVDGTVVWRNGSQTKQRPGKLLSPARAI